MPSEGGLLFIPATSWENLQFPLQVQVRGHVSSHQSKADRAGALVSSALLLSLLHTFLPWSVFEEPSKLISPGQGMRGGGGEGRECLRGKKCSRLALCWFKA